MYQNIGCIDADFCNQGVIFQHLSKSSRFSQFCAARIPEILQKFIKDFYENYGNSKKKIGSQEECGICRSRQELSNEYLIVKIGVDTAENEPSKICSLSV